MNANKNIRLLLGALALTTVAASVRAQEPTPPTSAVLPLASENLPAPATGSTAFCLYELPPDGEGKRRWVNLGIVQYVELARNELKIYYGGGNLGSGHEARLQIANAAQLQETLERLRQTAAGCR